MPNSAADTSVVDDDEHEEATEGWLRKSQMLSHLPAHLFLALFLVALIVWFSASSRYFLSVDNFRNILLSVAVLGIIAIPTTLLIVSANVDLSVGSTAAFCGMLLAVVAGNRGLALGIAAALAGGILLGAVNGALVAWIGINSIITTLGTLSIFRGATKLLSNGQTVGIEGFRDIGSGSLLGVPIPVWIFALVAAIFIVLMRYTVFGRGIYALGSNPHAARQVGIRPAPNLFAVFVITGGLSALAGLILTSQLRAATPLAGESLELSVIAAVLLGGASLTGGRGTVAGTAIGVLILGTLNNGLTILNVTSFWQEVARGLALIVAVGLDQLRRLRRS
jgi:ribose/xylose/arabinose/galactoside ABC-type transport system permease subunit